MGRRIIRLFSKDITISSVTALAGIEVNIELADGSLLNGYLDQFKDDQVRFQTKLKNQRNLIISDIKYLDYAK